MVMARNKGRMRVVVGAGQVVDADPGQVAERNAPRSEQVSDRNAVVVDVVTPAHVNDTPLGLLDTAVCQSYLTIVCHKV